MIVTLKPGCRIAGFNADCWQLHRHAPGRHTRAMAQEQTFEAAFREAISEGIAEPGKPLDLSGFHALIRDAARRFNLAGATIIRLGDGYSAERISGTGILPVNEEHGQDAHATVWMLIRDTGRGRKHAVKAGEAGDVAGILATAAWHNVFRAKREMTIDQVGPYLTGIAQRLLDGATMAGGEQGRTETAERNKLLAGSVNR